MHERRTARPHRPDAVAGPGSALPVGDLAALAARGWLIELLRARPLAQAAAIPVEEIARSGPELCELVLRALDSDEDLERLADEAGAPPAVALTGRLAGAETGPEVVHAVECLRSALWSVLTEGAALADAPALTGLGDRLAHVCAVVCAAAIDETTADARRFAAAPRVAREPAITDRRDRPDVGHPAVEPDGRGLPPDEPAARAGPLWVAALERQLAEGGRSGRPFALLLVELDDAERLRLAEPEPVAEAVFDRVGRAIRDRVRRPDLLAHERDGRTWVIAPEAGRAGAAALAERVADSVEHSGTVGGAALRASIGIAVFPHDGRDAEALIEHAEEQMFAARAAGIRIAGGDPAPDSAPPGLRPLS